jgi:N-acetylglucosamine repressor
MLDTCVTEEIVVLGIGVSSPGPIDINSGIILTPPAAGSLVERSHCHQAQGTLRYPRFSQSGYSCISPCGKNYGKGKKYKSFIQIDVINEGVGCGIIINDQLYRGVGGFGGEFGHISINVEGIQCWCGNIGCIECYAAISAILNKLQGTYPEIQSWMDLVLRSKDDEILAKVIKGEAHYLGAGILSVMNLLELEAVILSGEVVFEPYMLIDELRQYINSRSITRSIKSIDVLISNTDYTLSFTSSATIVSEKFFSGELTDF